MESEDEVEARKGRYLSQRGEVFSRDEEPLHAREIDPKYEPRLYEHKAGEEDDSDEIVEGENCASGKDVQGTEDLLADEYIQRHWTGNTIPRHVLAKMQYDYDQEMNYDKFRSDPSNKVPLDPMTWKKRHVRAWFHIYLGLGQYVGKFPADWQPEIAMDETTVGLQ